MKVEVRGMAGLTLVELVVAMAVLVVSVTIAIPSFQGVLERTRAAAAYHQLTASLMLARAAAITRREPVVMCPSADGVRCRSDLVWEEGWIVFPDRRRVGQPEDADAVLKRVDPIRGGLQVRSSRGRPIVRYLPSGKASGSNLSVRICREEHRLLGSVIVNNTGRARTQRAKPGATC